MKSLSIAITLNNTLDANEMTFTNGLSQNVKFLYDVLRQIGHKPYFMVSKPAKSNRLKFGARIYRAITYNEALTMKESTQIVMEVGVSVNEAQRNEFRKKFNSKIVSIRYGHTMFMDMEQICHAETLTPGLYVTKPDAVWASPHFKEAYTYLETVYQAPIKTCPYIWEPDFVSQKAETTHKTVPDIYVMEPNISILKNALIPIAIIENIYRSAPNSFGKATILNSLHFNQRPYFLDNIVKNFSCFIAEANKAFFTGRYTFDQVFKERDILLGHQHGCELNYLYLEALHRNIPLVHNSPAFAEIGYYYGDCDVYSGANQLKSAINNANIKSEAAKNKAFLKRYSIHNTSVQETYQNLLGALFS